MSLTHVTARGLTPSRVMPALLVAFLGLSVLFIAGHAQTQTLHNAAHDTRHANGFPCH